MSQVATPTSCAAKHGYITRCRYNLFVTPPPEGHPREGDHAVPDWLVTQREAAELVGCSKDTVIRARLAGRLPHARLEYHTWVLPVTDLIAAGLCDPGISKTNGPRGHSQEAASLASVELVRAQERVAALEDVVARQDDELRFLRRLTADTLVQRANS
jgi:hypothetical protein